MNNFLKITNSQWAGKLQRVPHPITKRKRIVVSAKAIYDMLDPAISFEQWCDWYIESTPLRVNIDYHYTSGYKIILLSISAAQAVLIMNEPDKCWMLFNDLSDLINSGFSTR